jgi:hypothetical protein
MYYHLQGIRNKFPSQRYEKHQKTTSLLKLFKDYDGYKAYLKIQFLPRGKHTLLRL